MTLGRIQYKANSTLSNNTKKHLEKVSSLTNNYPSKGPPPTLAKVWGKSQV